MKKLASILLTLVLLMSFIPSAFASGYTYSISFGNMEVSPECTSVEVSVSVSNLSYESTADNLFVVAYSEQNALLDISSVPVTLDPREVSSYSLSISADTPIYKVKAFVWDSWTNLTPLAEAVECNDIAPIQYAIALSARTLNGNTIKLLHSDGTNESHTVNSSIDVSSIKNALSSAGANVSARVVEYKIKASTGEISYINFINCEAFENEYKARTGKIGVYPITNSTVIIDATQVITSSDAKSASKYSIMSRADLVDGYTYKGYAFRKAFNTDIVVLTDIVDPNAKPEFTTTSRFAVVQDKAVRHYTDDDEECELVTTLYDGRDEQELLFVTGLYNEANLSIGDAFFFETDKYGFINAVYKVYDKSENTLITLDKAGDIVADDWSYNIWDEGLPIQLARGIIVEVDDKSISFAKWDDKLSYLDTNADLDTGDHNDGIITYAIADDTVAYIYDADSDEYSESDKFKAKSPTSIKASNFDRFETEDGIYEGDNMFDYANEALVMIVDGYIVAIYAIEK